ncbi:unnamed protein product [Amoebophrya sp. A120]|nr:unnamed protein product [Amoebophrya sp. A120]|eukprot:GSA120T00009362001.1
MEEIISRSPESSTDTPTIAAPTVAPAENAASGAAELDERPDSNLTSHKELQTTKNAAADEMQNQGGHETSGSDTSKNRDTNADDDLRFAVAPGGNFQFDPETGELFLQPQVMLSRRSSTIEEVGADGDSPEGYNNDNEDTAGAAAPELDEKAAIELDDEVIEPQAAQVVHQNARPAGSEDGQEVVAGPVQSENPEDAGGRNTNTETRDRGRALVPVSSEELHTEQLHDDRNKEMLDVASFCNPDVLVVIGATAQATAEPERLLAADDIGDKYLKTDGAKNEEKQSPDHDRQKEQSDLLAHIGASPPLLSLDSSSRLITPLQETMSPLVYNKVATLLGGIFDKVAASTIEEGDEEEEENDSTAGRPAGKGPDAEERDPRIIRAAEQDTTATSGEDVVGENEKIRKTSPGLRRVVDETTGVLANCRKDDGAQTSTTPEAQEFPALSCSSASCDGNNLDLHQQVETTTCSSSSRSTKEAVLAGVFSSSLLRKNSCPTTGIIAKKPSSVDSEMKQGETKDSVASSAGAAVAACTDGDDEAATGKKHVELHPVDAVSTSTNGGSKPTTDEEPQTTTATASPWISSLYGSTAHILSIGTAKIIQNVTNFIADDDDLEDYFVGGEYRIGERGAVMRKTEALDSEKIMHLPAGVVVVIKKLGGDGAGASVDDHANETNDNEDSSVSVNATNSRNRALVKSGDLEGWVSVVSSKTGTQILIPLNHKPEEDDHIVDNAKVLSSGQGPDGKIADTTKRSEESSSVDVATDSRVEGGVQDSNEPPDGPEERDATNTSGNYMRKQSNYCPSPQEPGPKANQEDSSSSASSDHNVRTPGQELLDSKISLFSSPKERTTTGDQHMTILVDIAEFAQLTKDRHSLEKENKLLKKQVEHLKKHEAETQKTSEHCFALQVMLQKLSAKYEELVKKMEASAVMFGEEEGQTQAAPGVTSTNGDAMKKTVTVEPRWNIDAANHPESEPSFSDHSAGTRSSARGPVVKLDTFISLGTTCSRTDTEVLTVAAPASSSRDVDDSDGCPLEEQLDERAKMQFATSTSNPTGRDEQDFQIELQALERQKNLEIAELKLELRKQLESQSHAEQFKKFMTNFVNKRDRDRGQQLHLRNSPDGGGAGRSSSSCTAAVGLGERATHDSTGAHNYHARTPGRGLSSSSSSSFCENDSSFNENELDQENFLFVAKVNELEQENRKLRESLSQKTTAERLLSTYFHDSVHCGFFPNQPNHCTEKLVETILKENLRLSREVGMLMKRIQNLSSDDFG